MGGGGQMALMDVSGRKYAAMQATGLIAGASRSFQDPSRGTISGSGSVRMRIRLIDKQRRQSG